jgi:hypothetical protein
MSRQQAPEAGARYQLGRSALRLGDFSVREPIGKLLHKSSIGLLSDGRVIDREYDPSEVTGVGTVDRKILKENLGYRPRIVFKHTAAPCSKYQSIALLVCGNSEDLACTLPQYRLNILAIGRLVLPDRPSVGRGAGDEINDIRLEQPGAGIVTHNWTGGAINHAVGIEAGSLRTMKGIVFWTLVETEIESRATGQALFLCPGSTQEASSGMPGGGKIQDADSLISPFCDQSSTALQRRLIDYFKCSSGRRTYLLRPGQNPLADMYQLIGVIGLGAIDTTAKQHADIDE